MAIEDGGPAFPCEQHETQDGTWNQTFERGMTLRDWFAGQALAGLLGNLTRPAINGEPVLDPDGYAKVAYASADAMLAERSKKS